MALITQVLALLLVLQTFLIVVQGGEKASQPWVCDSKKCTTRAAEIQMLMNESVSPCDDFWQYACGRWERAYGRGVSQWDILNNIVKDRVLSVLSSPLDPLDAPSVQAAKTYFLSCMNIRQLRRLGDQPIFDVIAEIFDDFPLDLTSRLLKVEKVLSTSLLAIGVGLRTLNTSRHAIHIDQPILHMQRYKYLEKGAEQRLHEYKRFVVVGLRSVEPEAPEDFLTSRAEKTVNFEAELAKISLSLAETENISLLYHSTHLSALQHKYPALRWRRYLQGLFDLYAVPYTVDSGEVVVSMADLYLQRLFRLLEHTPHEVVKDFLLWSCIMEMIPYTAGRLRTIKNAKYKQFGERSVPFRKEARAKHCTLLITRTLPDVAGHMYVQVIGDRKNRLATKFTFSIMKAFGHMIQRARWLSPIALQLARQKLLAMDVEVGAPKGNITQLDDKYGGIQLTPQALLDNKLAISRRLSQLALLKILQTRQHVSWPSSAAESNAFYLPQVNAIIIPAGLLAHRIVSSHLPTSLSYGSFGSVIGHEVMHGFDFSGREFDVHGNLRPWWSEQDIQKYQKRARCFQQQYDNFTSSRLHEHVNGWQTLDENIADNGGLAAAYHAFTHHRKRNGHGGARLSGLTAFTPEQLFFLSFAQTWCASDTAQILFCKLRTDLHSPAKYRVLGALRNNEHFARAFHCPLGSPMNPENKCHIW